MAPLKLTGCVRSLRPVVPKDFSQQNVVMQGNVLQTECGEESASVKTQYKKTTIINKMKIKKEISTLTLLSGAKWPTARYEMVHVLL